MSNIIELSAFKGSRSPKRVFPSENVESFEPRVTGRRRGGQNMHTFVFRSYNLIVQSDEADLMRDVCFDIHKAQVKLKAIRRQIAADREHAAAREKLLTSAESRLSTAIDAAKSLTPAPAAEVKPPRINGGAMTRRESRRPCGGASGSLLCPGIFPLRRSSQC
jgi:hypothetical protein